MSKSGNVLNAVANGFEKIGCSFSGTPSLLIFYVSFAVAIATDKIAMAGTKFFLINGLAKRSFYDGTIFVLSCTVYGISCNFFLG